MWKPSDVLDHIRVTSPSMIGGFRISERKRPQYQPFSFHHIFRAHMSSFQNHFIITSLHRLNAFVLPDDQDEKPPSL
jgi:hypothetical protein